jgi:hypothetical protein
MTIRMRNLAVALGLLVLGSLALTQVGCGTNSDDPGGAGGRLDSGSAQAGSNASIGTGGAIGGQAGSSASIGTGGATGGSGGSGTGGSVQTCYSYASGSFYCSPGASGCYYNPVTGCECADSPCKPLDPTCTVSTAHGTANVGGGTVDPKKNVSCYCDTNGYWWCGQ